MSWIGKDIRERAGGHLVSRNNSKDRKRRAKQDKYWKQQNGPVTARKATPEELENFGKK